MRTCLHYTYFLWTALLLVMQFLAAVVIPQTMSGIEGVVVASAIGIVDVSIIFQFCLGTPFLSLSESFALTISAAILPPATPAANRTRCSVPARTARSFKVRDKITIFVTGVCSRSLQLGMSLLPVQPHPLTLLTDITAISRSSTIGDILALLRRRHLIPSSTRLVPSLYFDSRRRGPLMVGETLASIGADELSTLFLRYRVLGGSTRLHSDDAADPPSLDSKRAQCMYRTMPSTYR